MALPRLLKMVVRAVVLTLPVIILWQVFLPPIGGIEAPNAPELKLLPASQNSEPEYALAVQECFKARQSQNVPSTVSDPDSWARRGFRYAPEDLTYLERFSNSAGHLKAGGQKTGFQYYTRSPSITTPGFDLFELRTTVRHAVARGLGLIQAGKVDEGVQLLLAAYTFGGAWASDAACPLDQGINGVGNRNLAATGLFYVIDRVALPRATLLEICRQVENSDGRLIPPSLYLQSEGQALDRYVYSVASASSVNPESELARLPRAMRERCYLEFKALQQDYIQRRLEACGRYDVTGLTKIEQSWDKTEVYQPTFGFLLRHPAPAKIAATQLFSVSIPNWGRALALLYLDRATARGLEALACLKAYKLAHADYPVELGTAFSEAGLKPPTDVSTSAPMGYRRVKDAAEVWLPGVDGKDDGGLLCYDRLAQSDPSVSGFDLVYSTRDIPAGFRRPFKKE